MGIDLAGECLPLSGRSCHRRVRVVQGLSAERGINCISPGAAHQLEQFSLVERGSSRNLARLCFSLGVLDQRSAWTAGAVRDVTLWDDKVTLPWVLKDWTVASFQI